MNAQTYSFNIFNLTTVQLMSVQIKSDKASKICTLDSKIVNARLIHGTINVKYYRND